MKPLVKVEKSFPITIYIAGKYTTAQRILKKYCDEVGFCVTLTMVEYIYKEGTENGLQVGLINYPRFPSDLLLSLTKQLILLKDCVRV